MDAVDSIQFFKLVNTHILQKKPHILQQNRENDKGILAKIYTLFVWFVSQPASSSFFPYQINISHQPQLASSTVLSQ